MIDRGGVGSSQPHASQSEWSLVYVRAEANARRLRDEVNAKQKALSELKKEEGASLW